MDYLKKALLVLDNAEKQLRDVISEAATNSQYDQVTTVTRIAQGIAKLRGADNLSTENHSVEGMVQRKAPGESTPAPQARVSTSLHAIKIDSSNAEFPRFETDQGRLVKLGWSSRDKRVYEHRVERDLVNDICNRLTEKANSRKPFKMEKLFPMKLVDGAEIPSYKAYLVLKWLQHFRIIERKGKDGYIFIDKNFSDDVIEDLWDRTPQRSRNSDDRGDSIEQ